VSILQYFLYLKVSAGSARKKSELHLTKDKKTSRDI